MAAVMSDENTLYTPNFLSFRAKMKADEWVARVIEKP